LFPTTFPAALGPGIFFVRDKFVLLTIGSEVYTENIFLFSFRNTNMPQNKSWYHGEK
jgi:hypothetical protein